MRADDSDREIARTRLMGRQKVALLRAKAQELGWLDPGQDPPDEPTIASVLAPSGRDSSTISSVQPWRELVSQWLDAGVQGKAIHAALVRQHGYHGSYSSVARPIVALRDERPPENTVRLSFNPGEAAQVDFGAGPVLCTRTASRGAPGPS